MDGEGTRIPRWVVKAIFLFWGTYFAFFLLGGVLTQLRGFLTTLLISIFLSFALEPAVNVLTRRGVRRGLATSTVMIGVMSITAIFIIAIGSLVFTEFRAFLDDAPAQGEEAVGWVNRNFGTEFSIEQLKEQIQDKDGPLQEIASRAAQNALSVGNTALGGFFQMLTVGLFTFYFVADGPRLRKTVCSFLPPDRQRFVLSSWNLAIEKTGGYIYSRAILAAFSALTHWIAFSIIGLRYAVALAVWMGFISQFLPVIGTYLAGALPVILALLVSPGDGLATLAIVTVYQQIENYLIAPRVSARTMSLHPAVAFGSVITGAALLGFVGAVLALPASALAQALITQQMNRYEVSDSTLDSERAPAERANLETNHESGDSK